MSFPRHDPVVRFHVRLERAVFLAALLAGAGLAHGGPPAAVAATSDMRPNQQPSAAAPPPTPATEARSAGPSAPPPASAASPHPDPDRRSGDTVPHDTDVVHDSDGVDVHQPKPRHKHHEPQPKPEPPPQEQDATAAATPDDGNAAEYNTSSPSSAGSLGVQRRHYTMDDLVNMPDPSDSNHHTMDELL